MRFTGHEKLPFFWIYYCIITGSFMLLQAAYFAICYIFPSLTASIVNQLMADFAFTIMLACLINSLPLFFSSIFFIIERRWFVAGFCLSACSW